jgi:hypothetical protein
VGVSASDAVSDTSAAAPFTPRTGLLIALVGTFAFCALAVLSAYAPDLRGGDNGGAHALSRSAIGYAGIVRALRLEGEPVLVNRAATARSAGAGLMVVTPSPGADEGAVTGLGFSGPVLVVLPKWFAPPDPRHRGWVGKGGLIGPDILPKTSFMADSGLARAKGVSRPVLRALGRPFALGETISEGPIDRLQTLVPKGWRSVVIDQTGATVLARAPDRPIFLLTDPDLLNTQGLRNLDTLGSALMLLRALRAGDGPIIFDVRLNGLGRARSVLRLLFEPPFLAVTLCLAAAAALAGAQAACRFGPIRRPPRAIALGKRALVDNSAALIRMAGREPHMGGRYALVIRDLAAGAVGAPRELSGAALVSFLDRLGERRGAIGRLSDLSEEARLASDRERLTAAARKLFQWRLEMTRERG